MHAERYPVRRRRRALNVPVDGACRPARRPRRPAAARGRDRGAARRRHRRCRLGEGASAPPIASPTSCQENGRSAEHAGADVPREAAGGLRRRLLRARAHPGRVEARTFHSVMIGELRPDCAMARSRSAVDHRGGDRRRGQSWVIRPAVGVEELVAEDQLESIAIGMPLPPTSRLLSQPRRRRVGRSSAGASLVALLRRIARKAPPWRDRPRRRCCSPPTCCGTARRSPTRPLAVPSPPRGRGPGPQPGPAPSCPACCRLGNDLFLVGDPA